MADHAKQALTPEEVIARKGNTPYRYPEARYAEGETTEPAHAVHHPTMYPGDEQLVRYAVHDTAKPPSERS